MDNSPEFQLKLKSTLNSFQNVIYCNEDCENLYKLGLHKGFNNIIKYSRNNKLGQPTKKHGGFEFLGYKSSFSTENIDNKSGNNTTYNPIIKKIA